MGTVLFFRGNAHFPINLPDAIQIATSLEAKADIFITNGATLKKNIRNRSFVIK
jgi:predicted acyltransferase (DUF342 family)